MKASLPVRSKFRLFVGIAGAALSACASPTLSLQSYPSEAEVYARPVGGGAEKLLGKTPLQLKASEVQETVGIAGPLFLEFRKEDHVPASAVLTDPGAVDLTLSMRLIQFTSLEQSKDVNLSIDLLFEAQRLARAGRLDDALKKIQEVQQSHPQLAASYELEGGIYYMQSKFKEAYDAYRAAAKLNPGNADARRMKNKLANDLGISERQPAAQPVAPTPGGRP